jgi:medium-chain acyl-[acyl-carrier-protein] hydrolase
VAPLVQALADVVRPLTDRPYALFGHSMGALLSFELARELRRQGLPAPRHLFVSGRRAPHLPPARRGLHLLPDGEFLEELRRLEGTPAEFFAEAELVQLALPALRADFELCDAYVYAPDSPLACPVTALGGTSDPGVAADDLDAWREHTTGDFRRHLLPGGHFYLLDAGPALAGLIAHELETSGAGATIRNGGPAS